MGLLAALSAAFVYIGSRFPSARLRETNSRALSEISCRGTTRDTSAYTTDWQSSGADYVVDMQTPRYFFDVPTPSAENPGRFAPLDYCDTAFIARFRRPASYNAPDGEVWRLYSRRANVGGKNVEIIIGYAEKAPRKMIDTPRSAIGVVDAILEREADKIAASPPGLKGVFPGARQLSADGFAIVDASTKQVMQWGLWLPAFLPKDKPLPTPGYQFYVNDGDLYRVRTDTNGRLLATSLISVGGLWWLVGFCAIAFLITSVIARALSRRFLRNYFATTGIRVPTLEEAQRTGEGQSVEFKRGFSEYECKTGSVEDELLKSIAAFANTNDGVIFIGIDDAGHVRGLTLDFTQKDRFERKIRQLVRSRQPGADAPAEQHSLWSEPHRSGGLRGGLILPAGHLGPRGLPPSPPRGPRGPDHRPAPRVDARAARAGVVGKEQNVEAMDDN